MPPAMTLAAAVASLSPAARRPGAVAASSANMLQLVQLRWIAVIGQVVTIAAVEWGFGIRLPLQHMALMLAVLVGLNLVSLLRLRLAQPVTQAELFGGIACDVLVLTVQLHLSGGATNPFVSLYLLQVVLAAIQLEVRWTWAMVALTSLCCLALTLTYRPLVLPAHLEDALFRLHLQGILICFVLDAVLLAVFITRITGNLRAHDAKLAYLRQQAVEEDHVVRMGLLASGAAHELGTPLATVSVILGDWKRLPAFQADPELMQEIDEAQAALARCKSIVTGILLSAGEARGEAPGQTTLGDFLEDCIEDWRAARSTQALRYENGLTEDIAIVADPALQQVIGNVLDNALEVSPQRVLLTARRAGEDLELTVSDDGPGFLPEMLAGLGRPYRSSKGRQGGGLGLFLVFNVLRKLGGTLAAHNRPGGGATVTLTLPLASLALHPEPPHAG